MRESNFAFPAQNKACVCITSQLYDRRALDTTSPLPLFNSLTHLTYLTSTSPRIREIMTMDGGLERLVRILHEFCLSPPPPENPGVLYGLLPPSTTRGQNSTLSSINGATAKQPPQPQLNPSSFDKHAAYRFSLAFQCVVNIGVRGSEPIRSRVVQAGTLDVVGCILEAWLAGRGFAVGPGVGLGATASTASVGGGIRETREQRQIRRLAALEMRQREDAVQLQRALQRQLRVDLGATRRGADDADDSMDYSPADTSGATSTTTPSSATSPRNILLLSDVNNQANSDTDVSTDNSIAATPQESGTPTGSVVIPSRDRSGTIIARPVWDHTTTHQPQPQQPHRRQRHRELPPVSPSPSPSTDASRNETETEDDGDGDVDMDQSADLSMNTGDVSASPSPDRRPRNMNHVPRHHPPQPQQHQHRGRAVGIVSDEPTPNPQTLQVGGMDMGVGLGLEGDAHIIINEAGLGVPLGMGMGMVGMGGVEVGMGLDGVGGAGGVGGVEDGIVSLEPNDDFAMGAPPGAPGALVGVDEGRRRATVPGRVEAPDVTPRAGVVGLPPLGISATTPMVGGRTPGPSQHQRNATIRARQFSDTMTVTPTPSIVAGPSTATGTPSMSTSAPTASQHARDGSSSSTATTTAAVAVASATPTANPTATTPSSTIIAPTSSGTGTGPYRDEDVLLSLQLLAYLSKYPHVRQAFYKPRVTFHPASVGVGGGYVGGRFGRRNGARETDRERTKDTAKDNEKTKETGSFFRSFAGGSSSSAQGRGKEKEKDKLGDKDKPLGADPTSTPTVHLGVSTSTTPSNLRQTNVFSLVERFTFKPSSSESDSHGGPPRLPPEIQYWAGVIMRNACRKDDSRGGIRQCANMLCGKWESYPREFAKCRRCRKAKYCGKECQSTAWSEGHRFWCSAKDVEEGDASAAAAAASSTAAPAERRQRERERVHVDHVATGGIDVAIRVAPTAAAAAGTTQRADRERERAERRQARERQQPVTVISSPNYIAPLPPGGPVIPASSGLATTPTSPTRAEPSMSRDRTVQPSQQQTQQIQASLEAQTHPPHVRVPVRPGAAVRPTAGGHQDPTNNSYLSFAIQGGRRAEQHEIVGARRRAETVTGASGAGSSSGSRSVMVTMEVPPNVVPHSRFGVMPAISSTAITTPSDWPMGADSPRPESASPPPPSRTFPHASASPSPAGGSISRRHRLLNLSAMRAPPPTIGDDDDDDDVDHMGMMLG